MDHYAILGVARTASSAEIQQAYRRLARQHHPDGGGGGDSAVFAAVAQAYAVLSDSRQRTIYDAQLIARDRAAETPSP